MKISLCMIVKDEEINIKECLDRALDVVDEVVIVDTGSVDSTLKILEQYKNRNVNVIEQKWNNDFSEARNKSIENAKGDYILILDADERIFCKREKLEEFLIYDDGLAYKIPIYNIFENKEMQITAEMIRLYKNQNPLYVGAIHEQITFDGKKNIGKVLDDSICKIYHYGYSKKVFSAKDKQKRNMDIIMAEIGRNPKDAFNWYNKGVMEMIAENYDIALNDFIKAHNLTKGTRMAFHNDLIIKMIQCLLMQKRYKKTIEFISPLLKDIYINTLPDLYYYLGLAYKEIKKYSMAKKNLLKALKIGDSTQKNSKFGIGSYMPLVELARIEKENKNIEKAYEKYEEAIFHENNINKYGLDEYRHFLKENNEENLLNDLNNRINKNSSNNQKYSEVKMIEYKKQFKENIEKLIEANMLNEATEMIYEYEKMFGKDILTFSVNGILSIIKGDYINAEKNFLQGLEKDSDDFDLLYNLGYLYRNIKNIDNAIKYLKSAFINSPNSEMEDEVFSILKELDIDETKESLRIKIYKSKEDSSKKNDNETNNINDITTLKDKFKQNIQILIEEGSLSEAKILISEYNDFEKNDADIYSMQGIIAIMENDYEYAEQLFFEGLEIDNSNLDLLYNLGYLNELKCQFINAYRYYQKALKFAENTIRNSICEKIENLLKHDNVVNYTKRKKVLFVAHIFPPVGGSGVQRSLKFVKYLRDFGWEPIVVTVGKTVYPLKDETMISEIPEEVEVIRIDERDNINPEYINQLIKLYSGIINDDDLIQEYIIELNNGILNMNNLWLIPDQYILWATEVIDRIESEIDFSKIDSIFTTSGPYSDHMIGYYLKKDYNIPWVADFRDEWTNNPMVNYENNKLRYKMDFSLEKNIVDFADRIVCCQEHVSENYIKFFDLQKEKVITIPNGYDEMDFNGIELNNKSSKKFTIIHNGLLYGNDRKIDNFIHASYNLIKNKRVKKEKYQVLIGLTDDTERYKKIVKSLDMENNIIFFEYVNHKESLVMASNAHALLLVIGESDKWINVPSGKIYEYLRLIKPIISLSPKNSIVEKMLSDFNVGKNFEFRDIEGLENYIFDLYSSWDNNEINNIRLNKEIQKFERRILTSNLSNLFNSLHNMYIFKKSIIELNKQDDLSSLSKLLKEFKKYNTDDFINRFICDIELVIEGQINKPKYLGNMRYINNDIYEMSRVIGDYYYMKNDYYKAEKVYLFLLLFSDQGVNSSQTTRILNRLDLCNAQKIKLENYKTYYNNTQCFNSFKLTVIMTTYNREKYILQSINSILNQTYKDFYLIILDNDSNDGTETLIKSIVDWRIIYIKNKSNIGFVGNTNKAFDICNTEYLSIIHDDDIFKPNFLDFEMRILHNNPNISLIGSNRTYINESGKKLTNLHSLSSDIIFKPFEYIKSGLTLCMPTLIYRMKFIEENKLHYCEDVGLAADTFFQYELNMLNTEIYFVAEPLVYYRNHTNQFSKYASQVIIDRICFAEKTFFKAHIEGVEWLRNRMISYLQNTLWRSLVDFSYEEDIVYKLVTFFINRKIYSLLIDDSKLLIEVFIYYYEGKIRMNYLENNKNLNSESIIKRWNEKIQNGGSISIDLLKSKINNIAVYGEPIYSYFLIKDCNINNINIKYLINNESEVVHTGKFDIPIYSINDVINLPQNIDAIIILYDKSKFYVPMHLLKRISEKIIFLEDLLKS